MKIIKIFLAFVGISLFVGLDQAYNGAETTSIKESSQTIVDEIETKQELKAEEKIEEKASEELKKEDTDKKQEIKSSNKKQDYKTKKQTVDTKQENRVNKSEPKKEKQNESKEVWDKLGISEYEYYNTPQWKWQTLSFELNGSGTNSCNSNTECRNKCIEYGEKYITQHEGGYRCSEVLSYSGKYLGEYFKFFELEN